MKYIDKFLNDITLYRLVLYSTILLSLFGIGFAFAGVLPLSGLHLLISLAVLLIVCALSNVALGRVFKIPVNAESSYITACILFLILPPPSTVSAGIIVAFAGLLAMVSKFVLNIRGRHLFNPAALAVLLIGFGSLGFATWWVGSNVLLVPVIICGLLIARKLRKIDLFLGFVLTAYVCIVATQMRYGASFIAASVDSLQSWPLVFFGSIMLTEPVTVPPTKMLRNMYGVLVGLLFGIPFTLGTVHSSPELALVLGNIFSYVVSPKQRLILQFKEKVRMAPLVYDFIFTPNMRMGFIPGQYMEWTLTNKTQDTRGNRRYFTIASSPTEQELHIGVKIPDNASSFKKTLVELQPGDSVVAGQLTGDFILPKDTSKKIVAIAGGIGITPFRSMVQFLTDTNQQRDMVLFYASADPAEFVYADVFERGKQVGVKTVRILSGAKVIPDTWKGLTGFITKELIEAEVPDYAHRLYYLSGPGVMVDAYKKLLISLNIPRSAIRTDYFPGY